jgi:hypothetical protein
VIVLPVVVVWVFMSIRSWSVVEKPKRPSGDPDGL